MEAIPSEPSIMAVDLSKSFSTPGRTRNHHAPALDHPAKPEWYHRRPVGSHVDTSYGTASYDGDSGVEPSYLNAALPPGVYGDGNLWCPTFYQADASCEDDSDSGSDVIVLLAAAKEPLLCASFVEDGVEPLSPAPSSPGSCQPTPSSQSSDTSSSEEEEEVVEESESSVDIPPHHSRPVVLLADLSSDYASAAHFHADMLSDDSDVVEVPVTQTARKRLTFNKIQDKSVPVERKCSVRIKPHSTQAPPPTWPARRRLARSAKKDAVGVYYESCDSDGAMGYALESDEDTRRCHTGSESDSSCQRRVISKTADKPRETDHSHRHVVNKSDDSLQRHASESDDAQQCQATNDSDNAGRRHSANKSDNSDWRRATNKSADTQGSSTKRKLSAVAKKTVKRQRRKRRAWCPPSSLFSPPEPQIKLKCTSTQEPTKKKKKTLDNFCPFVRVRQCANSRQNAVTVVNHQDQLNVLHQNQQSTTRSSSGLIPKTSCFRLGRLNGAGDAPPLCCLCGHEANADGLGDLHGPYLPVLSSLVKLPDSGTDDAAARHLAERWVHSDCSVWSSRVFLVRGNMYGLEEAEQLARDTMCCWCHQSGAIMGCSRKGCTQYFHYACALSSGCVLNEDNLSLRCLQHHMTTYQQQHEGNTQRKSWRAARRHVR
ncbi:uncharacterized protein LOC144044726 [Vanacampus margaritifer]